MFTARLIHPRRIRSSRCRPISTIDRNRRVAGEHTPGSELHAAMAPSSARMRDCSSLHFAEISPSVIAVELLCLPAGKASLLCAKRSFSLPPRGGTERSPDLFSSTGGVGAGLAPFASGPEAERLECTLAKAALQQTAAKKKTRPIRAKADMIERPCFRNFSRVFPITRPEIYVRFCAQTSAVEFMDRLMAELISASG